MGVSYKNFWSLNTDEAVVTGILRSEIDKKEIEVLMPMNAQMKGVDLVLMNIKTKKSISIQVKGSKAYVPKEKETDKFGAGSSGWFFLNVDVIHKATADYFIFLVYVIEQTPETGRVHIEPHTITIPAQEIKKLSIRHKELHPTKRGDKMYSFYFWVNPQQKEASDVREEKLGNRYYVSEYLDKKGFEKLKTDLKV
jgi:hypothetical protein